MTKDQTELLEKGIEWLADAVGGCKFGRVSLGVVIHNGRIVRLLRSVEDQPFVVAEQTVASSQNLN